ncbi:hypothetical protein NCAS_0C02070 [Naumovozyma castellii]|uniref:Uncharacterized protein n=1 Tax=Naumovozyma castellii TaxID=27288 RepID=G0VCI7_NAUCA|nr:hypothetical protein NCAS_0C02070 [Naumovozyma castellii CBS 4309]CCC69197.1 hypothetical protein NCAS_0C02070 [Naumovozyma castellii CBS 4309]
MEGISKITSVRRQKTYEDDDDYYDDDGDNRSIREVPRTIPASNLYTKQRINSIQKVRSASVAENPFFKPRSNAFSEPSDTTSKLDNVYSNIDDLETYDSYDPGNILKSASAVSTRFNRSRKNMNNSVKLVTKPNVDNQDKLWAELDALDDVKRVARTENVYNRFSEGFREKVFKIRESHVKLIQVLREKNAKLEEKQRRDVAAAGITAAGSISDSNSSHLHGSALRVAGSMPSSAGATVDPEEGKYIQQLVDTIRDIRS